MTRVSARRVAVVIALVALVAPFLAHAAPWLVGADASYVVASGSMEPAIGTGSVIWIAQTPAETIHEGDIITFGDEPTSLPTTHRVIERSRADGELRFRTQGDNNDAADAELVEPREIRGRYVFGLPYLGYAVVFARTTLGRILLVALPLALFALDTVWKYLESRNQNQPNYDQS